MCGIVGLIAKHGACPEDILRAMTRQIAHRGPDGEGIHLQGPVGLGHRRLSIIDPTGGHQPMCNEDGSVWITFNGEIYNYRELMADLQARGHQFKTRSDTEVVIHAWEEWGDCCVDRFRGMFAFGISDAREGCVFLARDHFGIKPLVYCETEEAFGFGSELAPLVRTPGFDATLDLQALDQYIWLQYIPAPLSAYRQIQKLPPAHRMRVGFDGRPERPRRYWSLQFDPEPGLTAEAWEERMTGVIRESVDAHLVADVPFGAFLSGGVDSSLVVAEMATLLKDPVRTFSIGFAEPEFDETAYAAFAAQTIGTQHTRGEMGIEALDLIPDLVRHYGEPFGDSSALPTWHVCKLARASVPMVLSGDGADELFAGYWSHGGWMDRHSMDVYDWISRIQYTETRVRSALWRPEFHPALPQRLESFESFWSETQGMSDLSRVQFMDINTYLPFDILTKVDIASMMHGLEVRTPFVDLKVMQAAARVPSNFAMVKQADGSWNRKALLKRVARRFFPEEFLNRPKMGFAMPMTKWLAPGGAAFRNVSERLLGPDSHLAPYFNPAVIKAMLDQAMTPSIWLLLMLEEWLRQHRALPVPGADRIPEVATATHREATSAFTYALTLKDAVLRKDWPAVRKGMRHLLATWPTSLEGKDASRWLAEHPTDPPAAGSIAAPAPAPRKDGRPRILFIVDVPKWIFERHARTLQTRLADAFDIEITYRGMPFEEADYDLIHPLEWHMAEPGQVRDPKKWVSGIRSHVSWEGLDFQSLCEFLGRMYQGGLYVVSERLRALFAPALPHVVNLAHGVDTTFFSTQTPKSQESGRLRVGWAGNRASAVKGFETYIAPLERMTGVELTFCGYSDRLLTLEEMRAFYEGIDAYICTSASEGHNNSLMEAAAMGCAIVTTDVGTVPEYLEDGRSALIVPREPKAIQAAIRRLRDEPALRIQLGEAAREAVVRTFDWSQRQEAYRAFFHRALAGAGHVAPPVVREGFLFDPTWSESGWVEVLLSYLQAFAPEDPVRLILPIHPGAPGELDLATAQSLVVDLVQRTGRETFPDVVLVDRAEDLWETLREVTHLQWIPARLGGGADPSGPYGDRFTAARMALTRSGSPA